MLYKVITIITIKTKKRKYWQWLSLGRGLVIKWRKSLCSIFVLLHYLNTLKFYMCISSILKQKRSQPIWRSYNMWMKTPSGWLFEWCWHISHYKEKKEETEKISFISFILSMKYHEPRGGDSFKETLQGWL